MRGARTARGIPSMRLFRQERRGDWAGLSTTRRCLATACTSPAAVRTDECQAIRWVNDGKCGGLSVMSRLADQHPASPDIWHNLGVATPSSAG